MKPCSPLTRACWADEPVLSFYLSPVRRPESIRFLIRCDCQAAPLPNALIPAPKQESGCLNSPFLSGHRPVLAAALRQKEENMKKGLTEIVFILDRSGSMRGLEADTIGGFNAMIEKQKKAPGEALISTILFDHESVVIHDRADIRHIRPMTDGDYQVRGCTALLDAIGGAVRRIGSIHKYARPEDVPEHTLFVITTDGMENASKCCSLEQVRQMIRRQESRFGWEFLFLGANMDAVKTASSFGIPACRAVTYRSDSRGTQLNYRMLNEAIGCLREGRPLRPDWKAAIEEDCTLRSGRQKEPRNRQPQKP